MMVMNFIANNYFKCRDKLIQSSFVNDNVCDVKKCTWDGHIKENN